MLFDWAIRVGAVLAAFLFLLQYAVKSMPQWLIWGGFAACASLILTGIAKQVFKPGTPFYIEFLIALGIAIVVGGVVKMVESPDPMLPQSAVSLKITGVRFDANGPTEIYVHFELDNAGEPSRLRNWLLMVDAKDGLRLTGHPRMIETKTTFPTNGPPIHEDLTVSPLEKGGFRSGYITYSHSGPDGLLMPRRLYSGCRLMTHTGTKLAPNMS